MGSILFQLHASNVGDCEIILALNESAIDFGCLQSSIDWTNHMGELSNIAILDGNGHLGVSHRIVFLTVSVMALLSRDYNFPPATAITGARTADEIKQQDLQVRSMDR